MSTPTDAAESFPGIITHQRPPGKRDGSTWNRPSAIWEGMPVYIIVCILLVCAAFAIAATAAGRQMHFDEPEEPRVVPRRQNATAVAAGGATRRPLKIRFPRGPRHTVSKLPSCLRDRRFVSCSGSGLVDVNGTGLVCVRWPGTSACTAWKPLDQCLGPRASRFRSLSECRDACERGNTTETLSCSAPESCSCDGNYRKANYIYHYAVKCIALPKDACVEENAGFFTLQLCKRTCMREKPTDSRCDAVVAASRSCSWRDKLFQYYYDTKSHQCTPWNEDLCPESSRTDNCCYAVSKDDE